MGDRRKFDDDEFHWYALDVVRQKEFVAGYAFNKRGWVTFIPTRMAFQKKNRYAKSKIEVARPDLPGVVFVGFPDAPNWFEVRQFHLVNGVLSVDNRPRRIDTASQEWIKYRGGQLDGKLVIERQDMLYRGATVQRSAALVQVQGRGVIRSPISLKAKAASDRPIVIPVTGKREKLKGMFSAAQKAKAA